ncbi:uncharacterized protein TRUGW13939_05772 [Talaromyces rugulosus]|uniref:Nucleoside phosphorylase domain-containing protein n=1 Tax=Talaromyces rugulosus TaxID=121627 RepID=A0A7H8QYV7_TALRU|nr:uncharacterized protein TRUGW13939_05772 [Talaromyces rugulosus]QKX58645.1 hypothetical protein TRUGW13939_05772 [Talaromyces rugulosus]
MRQNAPTNRDGFSIAIICALPLEADAVEALFDETYDKFGKIYGKSFRDNNVYINGRIGQHDVVLCYLPNMGKGSAASAAANLRVSYTEIQLALVVGICGGVPFPSENAEIVLGDVIISDSVVEYDFGGQYPDGFRRKKGIKGMLGPPPPIIRSHLEALKSHKAQSEFRGRVYQHLQALQQAGQEVEWQHPGIERDVLFEACYRHKHYQEKEMAVKCVCLQCRSSSDPICEEALEGSCDGVGCYGQKVPRNRHNAGTTNPFVHIGTIASADTVMKSGEHRDKMAKRDNVIGFEMEGAGVWRNMPCIIIKGVCDYADSHKNKTWQRYASATGASAAKTFLEYWIHTTRGSMTVPLGSAQDLLTAIRGSRDDNIQFSRGIYATVQQQTDYQVSALRKFSTSFAANQNTLQTQISSMNNTVEAVSSVSQGKMDTMMGMLQKISGRLEPSHIQTSGQKDSSGLDLEMIRSIERLCGLVQEKESTIDTYDDDQADGIIDDLQVILASAQKKVETTWQMPDKWSSEESERANSTDIVRKIQRFNRRFGRDGLGLNQGVQRRMFQNNTFTQQESSYNRIDIGIGKLTVRFNKRTRPLRITRKDESFHLQTDRDLTDYSMTVLFTPTNPQRFHMLVASFFEEEIYHEKMQRRSISSISRLTVNRVLPNDSPIFLLVRMGYLSTVQEMIFNDPSLLRCHDDNGRSLLFFSMLQPEMCKFLVENGLDVDHVAYSDNGWLQSPLEVEYPCLGESNSEEIRAVGQCYRLLLEAGADPTISLDKASSPFLSGAVVIGIPDIIRIAWNPEIVGHFADINTYDIDNCFAEMLRAGANINIRNADGLTCLHICLQSSGTGLRATLWQRPITEYETLKFLVESGADPRAVNFSGMTVSDVAYTTSGRGFCGSYPGDLWDCVLQSCDYNIKEFRSIYRRKAKYTRFYTREVFENLWQGREEFCPYWDDSPWPPREDRKLKVK